LLFLKIFGAILALGVGLYMGGSGRYRPDDEEIEKALGGSGYTKRAKRRFTLFGWLRQTDERSSHIRRRTRGLSTRRFDLIPPDKKKD